MALEREAVAEGRPLRVSVWGAAASGKTTLGQRLARALGAQYLELDAIHWGPGWTPISTEEFRARVAEVAACDRWVIDGEYYRKVGDLVAERADMVVWLDYGRPLLAWRLLRRTVGRVWRREVLWNENRETLRGAFFSRDSLLAYLLRTERARRRQRRARAAELAARGLRVVQLQSPREADAWLARAEAAWGGAPPEGRA